MTNSPKLSVTSFDLIDLIHSTHSIRIALVCRLPKTAQTQAKLWACFSRPVRNLKEDSAGLGLDAQGCH